MTHIKTAPFDPKSLADLPYLLLDDPLHGLLVERADKALEGDPSAFWEVSQALKAEISQHLRAGNPQESDLISDALSNFANAYNHRL